MELWSVYSHYCLSARPASLPKATADQQSLWIRQQYGPSFQLLSLWNFPLTSPPLHQTANKTLLMRCWWPGRRTLWKSGWQVSSGGGSGKELFLQRKSCCLLALEKQFIKMSAIHSLKILLSFYSLLGLNVPIPWIAHTKKKWFANWKSA